MKDSKREAEIHPGSPPSPLAPGLAYHCEWIPAKDFPDSAFLRNDFITYLLRLKTRGTA